MCPDPERHEGTGGKHDNLVYVRYLTNLTGESERGWASSASLWPKIPYSLTVRKKVAIASLLFSLVCGFSQLEISDIINQYSIPLIVIQTFFYSTAHIHNIGFILIS